MYLKYEKTYEEAQKHIDRLKQAFSSLEEKGYFPLDSKKVEKVSQTINQIFKELEYLTNLLNKLKIS